jgi:hypothetical protein
VAALFSKTDFKFDRIWKSFERGSGSEGLSLFSKSLFTSRLPSQSHFTPCKEESEG